jgi:hypothetical protein
MEHKAMSNLQAEPFQVRAELARHHDTEDHTTAASLLPANAMMPEAMRPGCAEALAIDGRFSPTGGCETF